MYKLTFYQLPKSKRWRWKFSYNKTVLARAEYHYASPAAAKKSFMSLRQAVTYSTEII